MRRTQAAAGCPAVAAGTVQIRQAGSADHEALRTFLTDLSAQTRYLRFFAGGLLASPAMLRVLAGGAGGVDAVVATCGGVIIGHAMAAYDSGPGGTLTADIGVVVADDWQGRGVGSWLIRTLVTRARARGTTTLVMDVLAENRRVLTMIANRWPEARHDPSAAQVTVRAQLTPLQGDTGHGRRTGAQRPRRDGHPDGRAGERRHAPTKPAAVIPVG